MMILSVKYNTVCTILYEIFCCIGGENILHAVVAFYQLHASLSWDHSLDNFFFCLPEHSKYGAFGHCPSIWRLALSAFSSIQPELLASRDWEML